MVEVFASRWVKYQADQQHLSLLIPAYNEAKGIGPVLGQLSRILAELEWPYELIVIDDGSQDNTAALAESTARMLLREILIAAKARGELSDKH